MLLWVVFVVFVTVLHIAGNKYGNKNYENHPEQYDGKNKFICFWSSCCYMLPAM